MHPFSPAALCCATALFLAACPVETVEVSDTATDTSTTTDTGTTIDTGATDTDTTDIGGQEVAADAGTDADDIVMDVTEDAVADTLADSGSDTTTDATTDVAVDTQTDATMDTAADVVAVERVCELTYELPADIGGALANATQDTFDELSWKSFLALAAPSVGGQASTTGDNKAQWESWSSTADLLDQGPVDVGAPGTRFYPPTCLANYPDTHMAYRVLDQVGKVDDSFQEAQSEGLSKGPVIDRNGRFLRYEILISPATYADVVAKGYNVAALSAAKTDDFNVICGKGDYTGGDPANPDMGALQIKLAWMDITGLDAATVDPSKFHVEQLLAYTPAWRNKPDGDVAQTDSCELRTMALVGVHIAHKTTSQPAWVWSTFEHVDNAPLCSDAPTFKPSAGCPASVDKEWNFYGTQCSDDAAACKACNEIPTSNDPDGVCKNDTVDNDTGWCVNQPPATMAGTSKLCRQVPFGEDGYTEAGLWNDACQAALGTESAWSNYMLISTQWYAHDFGGTDCKNVSKQLFAWDASKTKWTNNASKANMVPQPTWTGGASVLGNTAMESYEKSNCVGCHAKSTYGGNLTAETDTYPSTDFMYWLKLEVPEAPVPPVEQ